jgi:hypothetical protein
LRSKSEQTTREFHKTNFSSNNTDLINNNNNYNSSNDVNNNNNNQAVNLQYNFNMRYNLLFFAFSINLITFLIFIYLTLKYFLSK